MPEVVVYLLEGRSLEQKRGLVKDITQAVVRNAGTTADQVTVSLVETSENLQSQRWCSVQRNVRAVGESHSRREPRAGHGVNNSVSALHNMLAAVQ